MRMRWRIVGRGEEDDEVGNGYGKNERLSWGVRRGHGEMRIRWSGSRREKVRGRRIKAVKNQRGKREGRK